MLLYKWEMRIKTACLVKAPGISKYTIAHAYPYSDAESVDPIDCIPVDTILLGR